MDATFLQAASLLLGGGGVGAAILHFARGRAEARKIGVEADQITAKAGPEVESISIGNAAEALKMQSEVNARLAAENARLSTTVSQLQERNMLLENVLRETRAELEAANAQVSNATRRLDAYEREMEVYREAHPETFRPEE